MNISDEIKRSLNLKSVIEYYGGKPGRNNKMVCPFHREKTASFTIKGQKWKCFGCQDGGSAIDYVMKLFNLTLTQTVIRLNHDFNLGLTEEKPDKRKIEAARKAQRDKTRYERAMKLIEEWHLIEYRKQYRRFHDLKPGTPGEELTDEFIDAMLRLNAQEIWLEHWR